MSPFKKTVKKAPKGPAKVQRSRQAGDSRDAKERQEADDPGLSELPEDGEPIERSKDKE